MNRRSVLTFLACLALAMSLGAMLHTRQKLHELRQQQAAAPAQPTPAHSVPEAEPVSPAQEGVPLELLRLRAEVTRLNAVKNDLNAAALRPSPIAVAPGGHPQTNIVPLPPGYMRKSKAAFVGYSSVENTLQSFLWTIQNKDADRIVQAFTPDAGERLKGLIRQQGSEEFFKQAEKIPGMFIKERQELEDGTTELKLEIIPGLSDGPSSSSIKMKQVNGEWKIATPL